MKAKVSGVKQMIVPALGVGAGMLASPKVASLHPTLAKYPELSPLILLVVAILLLGVKKARSFGIGLGAVALVFLIIALYNRVKTKAAPAGAPTNGGKPIPYGEPGHEPYTDPFLEGIGGGHWWEQA